MKEKFRHNISFNDIIVMSCGTQVTIYVMVIFHWFGQRIANIEIAECKCCSTADKTVDNAVFILGEIFQ